MKNKWKIPALAGVGILLVVGVLTAAVLMNRSPQTSSTDATVLAQVPPPPAPGEARPSRFSLTAGQVSPPSRGVESSDQAEWKRFQNEYGQDLIPKFLPDGTIASIRGGPGAGRVAGGFQPNDVEGVRRRAREVMEDLADLIGVDQATELQGPTARGDSNVPQAEFFQTADGLPIEPLGRIRMDLGKGGELIGVYSEYVRNVRLEGEVRLNEAEARKRVKEALPGETSSLPVGGGRLVAWVVQAVRTPSVQARRAYEFYWNGRRVVVDSENGRILSNQSHRSH